MSDCTFPSFRVKKKKEEKVGPRRVGPRRVGGLKFSVFLFSPQFSFFFISLEVFSLDFGGV